MEHFIWHYGCVVLVTQYIFDYSNDLVDDEEKAKKKYSRAKALCEVGKVFDTSMRNEIIYLK